MSWFSEIAGRAEALLDRVDQAAASSIQGVGLGTPPKQGAGQTSLTYEPTATVNEEKAAGVASKPPSSPLLLQKSKTPTQSYAPVSRPEAAPKTPTTPSSYQAFSKSKNAAPNDDSIFEFLNTPSKESAAEKRHKPKTRAKRVPLRDSASSQMKPPSPVSTQPSVGVGEEGGWKKKDGGRQAEEVVGEEQGGSLGRGREEADGGLVKEDTVLATALPPQPTTEVERQVEEPTLTASAPQPGQPGQSGQLGQSGQSGQLGQSGQSGQLGQSGQSGQSSRLEQQLHTLRQKVSSLELENKLLKREVASLNDELGTLVERVREAEEGVATHRGEVETLREQATRSDHVIRQLRSQEEDLQAVLEARDSQIQVLRKELREVEQREAVLQERLDGHSREKERLVQDATLSSEAHGYALEGLKSQLAEAELQLKHEREATQAVKVEFAECESLLQHEQQQLSEALATQQRQLALQQARCAENQAAVQATTKELQKVQKEHEDYKKRAAGILQAKEKLISSLQTREGSGPAHEAKLEELRLEKEHLQAELERAQQQWAELKEELQETEERHAKETEDLLERVQQLESNLMAERSLQKSAQEDVQRASLELEAARENWERESTSLVRLAKEKETEIEELKAKVPATPLSPHSHSELEARLHELTESLIQKQTTLEALSSEKNSLKVQLERTESQLLSARRAHPPPTHTTVNGLDTVAAETRIRPMSSVLPVTDPAHSGNRLQNVRRAMNSLDSFSVRLALFLRRYPYARLFVFFYMVLLHVWVLIVLLTYSPEVHDLPPRQTP